jgi:hypothetical protein
MTLHDECLAFSKYLVGGWNDDGDRSARGLRLSYLYCNALRASHTSGSITMLCEARKLHDCHTLARSLFERMIRGRYAGTSEEKFLNLLGGELNEEIEKIEEWEKSGTLKLPNVGMYRAHRQQDINLVLKLTEKAVLPKKVSVFKMAKEIPGGKDLYQALYRELCLYAHATYGVSRPGEGDNFEGYMVFLVNFAPIDCSMSFYDVRGVELPDAIVRYAELKERCLEAMG